MTSILATVFDGGASACSNVCEILLVLLQLSNGDVYEKTHDELDFEFLGSRRGGQWRVQTNAYGNGSTSHGREERYLLPFDPTLEAHRYSVLWAPTHIM